MGNNACVADGKNPHSMGILLENNSCKTLTLSNKPCKCDHKHHGYAATHGKFRPGYTPRNLDSNETCGIWMSGRAGSAVCPAGWIEFQIQGGGTLLIEYDSAGWTDLQNRAHVKARTDGCIALSVTLVQQQIEFSRYFPEEFRGTDLHRQFKLTISDGSTRNGDSEGAEAGLAAENRVLGAIEQVPVVGKAVALVYHAIQKDQQELIRVLGGKDPIQLFKSYFPDVSSEKLEDAIHYTLINSGASYIEFGMDLLSISRGNGGEGYFLRGMMNTIRSFSHIPFLADGVMVSFLKHLESSAFDSPGTLVGTIRTFAHTMEDADGDSRSTMKFGMNRDEYCKSHSTRENNAFKLYMNKLLPLIKNLTPATELSNEIMQSAGFSIGATTINSRNYRFCYKSLGSILVKSFAGVHLLDTIRTRLIYTDLEKAQSASQLLRNILDEKNIDYTGKICSGNWNGVNIQFRPIQHVSVEVQFEVHGLNRSHETQDSSATLRTLSR